DEVDDDLPEVRTSVPRNAAPQTFGDRGLALIFPAHHAPEAVPASAVSAAVHHRAFASRTNFRSAAMSSSVPGVSQMTLVFARRIMSTRTSLPTSPAPRFWWRSRPEPAGSFESLQWSRSIRPV